MNDFPARKDRLRREALARRDLLDPAWRAESSLAMMRETESMGIEAGDVVSGFWPIRSEVDIKPFMCALHDRGARLCLPAILDRTTIVFRAYEPAMPLIPMAFGTRGPGPDAAILDPQIMLVPLAAFDPSGHRIGYGGGYFDRAIARLRARGLAPRLVGVAFDCQEIDAVPSQPHDVVLDEILTESGLRAFRQHL